MGEGRYGKLSMIVGGLAAIASFFAMWVYSLTHFGLLGWVLTLIFSGPVAVAVYFVTFATWPLLIGGVALFVWHVTKN